jgi:acyl carrier protein
MTEKNDVSRRLTTVFHDVFDNESIALKPEMTAADIDEWDSLTHIRLVLSVEKEFGLKFSAAEVGALKNVGDFITLIQSKL